MEKSKEILQNSYFHFVDSELGEVTPDNIAKKINKISRDYFYTLANDSEDDTLLLTPDEGDTD